LGKFYGIFILKYVKHKIQLNDDDLEFLVSCCIGDGSIRQQIDKRSSQKREYYNFNIRHSTKQSEFLNYKAERLNKILGRKAKVREIDNNGYPGIAFGVGNSEILRPIYELLYKNKKKTVTKECLKLIGLQGLGIWWMDDGSLTIRRKKTKHGTITNGARLGYLSTYTDEAEESELIANWISSLTGILPRLAPSKGKFRLMFNSHDLRAFCPIIEPYIIPSMKYKVDCKWINKRNVVTTPAMFTPKHLLKS